MSDSKDLKRAWADESPYILVYNALRAHDAEHGTDLASVDADFAPRIAMWEADGLPWDIQDDAQRLALFRLLFWDAVKDRIGYDKPSAEESETSA